MENDLEIQVRLTLLDMLTTTFNATVLSAVVVKQGAAQLVQVEESDEGLTVYVNGSAISIPTEDDSNLIVAEGTSYNSFNEFIMTVQSLSTDYISLRYDNDEIVIATSSGASVMVSNSSSVLHLAVEVSESFINSTEGILGYFNGDPSDDFRRQDGSTLPTNSSEHDLFDYGQLCELINLYSLMYSIQLSSCTLFT